MRISDEGLGQALRTWLAEHRGGDVAVLDQALKAVYRNRPPAISVEAAIEQLLRVLARTHAERVTAAMDRLAQTLHQLLEDLHALGEPGTRAVSAARHRADLERLATAMVDLSSFQGSVLLTVGQRKADLRAGMLRDLIAGKQPKGLAAAEIPLLTRITGRGDDILSTGEQALNAWHQGYTLESAGDPVPVPWRDNPELVARMNRMDAAMARYRARQPTDPIAAERAVEALRREVARGTEALRSHGVALAENRGLEPIPPTRSLARDANATPGSTEAAALDVRTRLTALARLAGPGRTPRPARADLFAALEFSSFDVLVEGVVREPLPRAGLERHMLSPGQIRALDTEPGWLARRLAELLTEWQRSHQAGAGVAAETFAGMAYAPEGVNQIAQNRGIEKLLRAAGTVSADVEYGINATVRRLAIPLRDGSFEYVDILGHIHYEIPAKVPGDLLHFDITVERNGSWTVDTNVPRGVPGADVPRSGVR